MRGEWVYECRDRRVRGIAVKRMRDRWEVIRFACQSWPKEEDFRVRRCAPCPPEISHHPWSISFKRVWPWLRGMFIASWDEIGVRNHILHIR